MVSHSASCWSEGDDGFLPVLRDFLGGCVSDILHDWHVTDENWLRLWLGLLLLRSATSLLPSAFLLLVISSKLFHLDLLLLEASDEEEMSGEKNKSKSLHDLAAALVVVSSTVLSKVLTTLVMLFVRFSLISSLVVLLVWSILMVSMISSKPSLSIMIYIKDASSLRLIFGLILFNEALYPHVENSLNLLLLLWLFLLSLAFEIVSFKMAAKFSMVHHLGTISMMVWVMVYSLHDHLNMMFLMGSVKTHDNNESKSNARFLSKPLGRWRIVFPGHHLSTLADS
jgi:hypothetical protein